MPWSLQNGAMLHLQVQEKNIGLMTNTLVLLFTRKLFFLLFFQNHLTLIMIINIFIFNHRFTDCFLFFSFIIQELMYLIISPRLSGMKSRNKRREAVILGHIFLMTKMLRFGSIPSSFQEILPRKQSLLSQLVIVPPASALPAIDIILVRYEIQFRNSSILGGHP